MAEIDSKNCRGVGNRGNNGHLLLQITLDFFLMSLKIVYYLIEGLVKIVIPVPQKPVKGEIVLITGAGHGLGKELALLYASCGATVVCWDINEKANQETVKEIASQGYPKAFAFQCNVTNRNEVMETAKRVQTHVGDVSILVNNAGIMTCRPFLQQSPEEIQKIMDVNVMGNFWTLQAILPVMVKNNHGHIVCISSGCGLAGLRYLVPYCTSKFAVRGMMEVLYQELYSVNPQCKIQLTTVYPYMIDTGLCKKPIIRFPRLMKLLNTKDVAKVIVKAQRTDTVDVSIPKRNWYLITIFNLLPKEIGRTIQKFFDFYVDADD